MPTEGLTEVKFFKERDRIFEFAGLKPKSTYYFYVNGQQANTMVKPFGKKLNNPLISDDNGKLKIVYYFGSDISSTSVTSAFDKLVSLRKSNLEFVLTDINQAQLPLDLFNVTANFIKIVYPESR